MAAKTTIIYTCSNCDAQQATWLGRCSECGQFGTIASQPETIIKSQSISSLKTTKAAGVTSLRLGSNLSLKRFVSGLNEVDRVLGGGLVEGGVTLLTGEPGAGKSTLLLALADSCSQPVLYASGEEALEQIEQRARRLKVKGDKLGFTAETNIQAIAQAVRQNSVKLLIIDSLQTVVSEDSLVGSSSPNQLKSILSDLVALAKETKTAVMVIGHVIKSGQAAGPKTIEHLVDVVLSLESLDKQSVKILRATKNRFGSTDEVGVFQMEEGGLIEVNNPSALFLDDRHAGAGSCITALQQGSRSLLVEVQALVTRVTKLNYPKRATTGYDSARLQLLIAVLEEKVGLKFGYNDVYVNLAGGLKSREPALDLAVCLAVISARQKKPLAKDLVVFGEVGLGGEIRAVNNMPKRLQESARLGFKQVLCSKLPNNIKFPKVLEISVVGNLFEVMDWL
ncbi:DNA repair protein RadA [Patescibacteria group bacterium]|nr:DNA repair protein RadA [Patescibacteria group bacterium]